MLEAVMLCVDTSEWLRNGDFIPTRRESQHDAVNLLSSAKTMQHPESRVGLLTGAGRPRVLATLTQEVGPILQALHRVELGGEFALVKALQVAQLALKHRLNKHSHQRVIVFVGSPIKDDERSLVRCAKQMKKNGIAVDIVVFGGMGEEFGPAGAESAQRQEHLVDVFIENCDPSSHKLVVPPGTGGLLSDSLRGSAILRDPDTQGGDEFEGGAGAGSAEAAGGGGADRFAEWGGIDPSVDPEMAAAMKASLQAIRAEEESGRSTTEGATEPAPSQQHEERADDELDIALMEGDEGSSGEEEGYDEEAELAAALAMSVSGGGGGEGGDTAMIGEEEDESEDAVDEDEELRLAMEMSMAEAQKRTEGGDKQ